MRNCLLLLPLLISTVSFAISERNYESEFQERVVPFFAQGTRGTLVTNDGTYLHYRVFRRRDALGVIVFVPGYAETVLKYQELAYDLWSAGYSVYTMDLRGMGLSGRALANRQIVHVTSFDHYANDLDFFVRRVVAQDAHPRKFLLTHSTGGLVAAKYLARDPHHPFRAAVFSAPLFQLHTGRYWQFVASGIASLQVKIGRGARYARGYGDLNFGAYTFDTNNITHSAERFNSYVATLRAEPEIRQGGPSYLWVRNAFYETHWRRIEALGTAVNIPVLIYRAGRDEYVLSDGQTRYCNRARNCRLTVYPGARHEILREVDSIRNEEALPGIFSFLSRY